MGFELGILPTKRFIGDVVGVESTHQVVIKFKPRVSVFPFFYKTVVMTTVSGAHVDNNPCQFVLEVFGASNFIVSNFPVFVEIVS